MASNSRSEEPQQAWIKRSFSPPPSAFMTALPSWRSHYARSIDGHTPRAESDSVGDKPQHSAPQHKEMRTPGVEAPRGSLKSENSGCFPRRQNLETRPGKERDPVHAKNRGKQPQELGLEGEVVWTPSFVSTLPKYEFPSCDHDESLLQELTSQREEIRALRADLDILRHELQDQRALLQNQSQLGESFAREAMLGVNNKCTSFLDDMEQRLKVTIEDGVRDVMAYCQSVHDETISYALDIDSSLFEGMLMEPLAHSVDVQRDVLRCEALGLVSPSHAVCHKGPAVDGQDAKADASAEAYLGTNKESEMHVEHKHTREAEASAPSVSQCQPMTKVALSESQSLAGARAEASERPSLISKVFEAVWSNPPPREYRLSGRC